MSSHFSHVLKTRTTGPRLRKTENRSTQTIPGSLKAHAPNSPYHLIRFDMFNIQNLFLKANHNFCYFILEKL